MASYDRSIARSLIPCETPGCGTGCTYASAITAQIAKGHSLSDAINKAKAYTTSAIQHGLTIGQGQGPTHHFFFLTSE